MFGRIRATIGFSVLLGLLLLCSGPTVASELGKDWTQATSSVAWGRRWWHKAVVYNGKMWVMGGYDHFGDVWYSSDGTSWTRTIEGSRATDYNDYAAVVFNGKIWTLGSSLGREVYNSTDGKTWTRVLPDPPWAPRSYAGAVVHNGKIWILGGVDLLHGMVYRNDVWNSADGIHWTSVAAWTSWYPRYGHQALSFDGKLWVLGGYFHYGSWDGLSTDVWYSYDGISWKIAAYGRPYGLTGEMAVTTTARRIWMIGGALCTVLGDVVEPLNEVLYSNDGSSWQYATTAAPWERRTDAAVLVYKQRLWILGGLCWRLGPSGWYTTPTADVWYSPIPASASAWKLYP